MINNLLHFDERIELTGAITDLLCCSKLSWRKKILKETQAPHIFFFTLLADARHVSFYIMVQTMAKPSQICVKHYTSV